MGLAYKEIQYGDAAKYYQNCLLDSPYHKLNKANTHTHKGQTVWVDENDTAVGEYGSN